MMKCPKCNTKNIVKASFCKECKYEFTEEEQEKAYKKTIFGKLETIETWYNHLTLSTITDHIAFKILMLLIVLAGGLYYYFTRGIDTNILESESYTVYYNKKNDEYYLIVDDNIEEISLNMYIPNRVMELDIEHYNLNNELIDKGIFEEEKGIKLQAYKSDYYILKSRYELKTEKLKVYVYPKRRVGLDTESK
jgi:hypothetical protein